MGLQNPYQPMMNYGGNYMGMDPAAEEREKAPGLRARDLDYVVRQAWVEGRHAGAGDLLAAKSHAWQEGHAAGVFDGAEATKKRLRNELFGTLNALKDRVDRELAPKSTIAKEREVFEQARNLAQRAYDALMRHTKEEPEAAPQTTPVRW